MKKIIIGVIIILLLILGYFMSFKSINLGKIKIESIKNIKDMSNNLDTKLQQAYVLADQTYPKQLNNLEDAMKKLETNKNRYNSKIAYNQSTEDIFKSYIRNYKIETLMVQLGRYSKQNNLKDLKIDFKSKNNKDVFDLDLTLVGTYESVYNFIYSIENDDDLLFEIKDLNIEPYMIKTTTTISNPDSGTSNSEVENPHNIKETITSAPIIAPVNGESDKKDNNTALNNSINTNNKNNTNNNQTSTTKKDEAYDPKNVQVQFTIEDIMVTFE